MQAFSDIELKELMEEIKRCLPDFPITLRDLKSPKSQFMTGYFYAALKDSGVVTTCATVHPKYECQDVTAHIQPVMKLWHLVKAFFPEKVGLLQNMGIETLLDPKPSDIQYVKAVNNFLRFSLRRVADIGEKPVLKERAAKVSNLEEMNKKHWQLQEMMAQQVEDGHLMESRISELDESVKKMKGEIVHLKPVLESEQMLLKDLIETESNTLHEIKKSEEELSTEEQGYRSLAPQLVQSPERILLTKEEYERKMESSRKEIEDLSADLRVLIKLRKEHETEERSLLSTPEDHAVILKITKEAQAKERAISALKTEQEQIRTKIPNKVKEVHTVKKTKEDYNLQQVVPIQEKIKELKRKEKAILESHDLQSRSLEEFSSVNLRLHEDFSRLKAQHNEELNDLGKKLKYIDVRCKAFVAETRQTWAAIVEEKRENLRRLKEDAEKELQRLNE